MCKHCTNSVDPRSAKRGKVQVLGIKKFRWRGQKKTVLTHGSDRILRQKYSIMCMDFFVQVTTKNVYEIIESVQAMLRFNEVEYFDVFFFEFWDFTEY